MTQEPPPGEAVPKPGRQTTSGDLGLVLRAILLDPKAGFLAALTIFRKRAQSGSPRPEGSSPYFLSALGGASAMCLWLKLGGLLGRRDVSSDEFEWGYLAAALVAGAIAGVVAMSLWALAGPLVWRGHRVPPLGIRRFIWGAAAFPQLGALFVLVPLDLLIVGPDTFTTERLSGALESTWAALSLAAAVSLALWSMYLFARGVSVAAGDGTGVVLIGITTALSSSVVSLALFVLIALLTTRLA